MTPDVTLAEAEKAVEFIGDKIALFGVDEETEPEIPVVDMTVGFPTFMVDVAEFSLEHDSVQASSEVV